MTDIIYFCVENTFPQFGWTTQIGIAFLVLDFYAVVTVLSHEISCFLFNFWYDI